MSARRLDGGGIIVLGTAPSSGVAKTQIHNRKGLVAVRMYCVLALTVRTIVKVRKDLDVHTSRSHPPQPGRAKFFPFEHRSHRSSS